jgi:hypothetical protein
MRWGLWPVSHVFRDGRLSESSLALPSGRLVAQIFTRWNRIVDWLWQIASKPHKQSSQQLTVLWSSAKPRPGKAIVRRRP